MELALQVALGVVGLMSIGGLLWLRRASRDEFDDPEVGSRVLDEHRRPASHARRDHEVDATTEHRDERTGGKHRR